MIVVRFMADFSYSHSDPTLFGWYAEFHTCSCPTYYQWHNKHNKASGCWTRGRWFIDATATYDRRINVVYNRYNNNCNTVHLIGVIVWSAAWCYSCRASSKIRLCIWQCVNCNWKLWTVAVYHLYSVDRNACGCVSVSFHVWRTKLLCPRKIVW